jgi:hypothetical protein
VQAGNTTATWDIYISNGPGASNLLPTGILPFVPVFYDQSASNYYLGRTTSVDGQTATNVQAAGLMLYNGTSEDRARGNLDNISLISASGVTTTQTSVDQTNYNGRGVLVIVDVTALTATGTLTPEIDFKDPVSGKYISLLTASTAIIATGTYVYLVFPGGNTSVANSGVTQAANMPLPRTWRSRVVPGNSVSITYTVGVSVII